MRDEILNRLHFRALVGSWFWALVKPICWASTVVHVAMHPKWYAFPATPARSFWEKVSLAWDDFLRNAWRSCRDGVLDLLLRELHAKRIVPTWDPEAVAEMSANGVFQEVWRRNLFSVQAEESDHEQKN